MHKTKDKPLRRNNKSRSQAFKNFLFYKNIICFDCVLICFVFVKKGSFPAKTTVHTQEKNLGQIRPTML